MTWLLAFLGFAVLIILHEAGHFFAAKAVGMRVERFSLFFPPLIAKRKRGETEYAIGAIPLGGYVKITGMNPAEDIPPEHAHRAYYRQPVWKRIVVIGAGPAVNIVLAFVIIAGVFMARGPIEPPLVVGNVEANLAGRRQAPARRQGDRRRRQAPDRRLQRRSSRRSPRPSAQHKGDAVSFTVDRDGQTVTDQRQHVPRRQAEPAALPVRLRLRPGRDAHRRSARSGRRGQARERDVVRHLHHGQPHRADLQLREAQGDRQRRRRLRDDARRRSRSTGSTALYVLALISLSLGVINLFPFLPLDGGHIFWALAEKVRGKAIPFAVMERAGFVGFALVLMLFVIGLSNDIEPNPERRLRSAIASPHGGETLSRRRDDRRGLPAHGRGQRGPHRGPHEGRRDRLDVDGAGRDGSTRSRAAWPGSA